MNPGFLLTILLRSASLLVPAQQRDEWLEEWHSELWYVSRDMALATCLGSFQDAFWVRRNTAASEAPFMRSPWKCLAVLVAGALAGLGAADWLIRLLTENTVLWRLSRRDLFPACLLTVALSILLGGIWALSGSGARRVRHLPGRNRILRAAFFTTKLAAVQPVLVCAMFVCVLATSRIPLAPAGCLAVWYLVLRWVIDDQQNRCPECLNLLDHPVRIGTRSATFLEWHGAETACPRGHGLLHSPESASSYTTSSRWLHLDASWAPLSSRVPGSRI